MSQRKNYHTVRYGTRDGEIQFGHIHKDNNESAVMLRSGHDFIHYISMDHTGNDIRKHGTVCRSPGSFQVKAGDNAKVTDDNKNNDAGITMDAVSGDIILRAPQGKIQLVTIIDCVGKIDRNQFVGYVNGKPYYGPFHIHPETGQKMVGARHVSEQHDIITSRPNTPTERAYINQEDVT